MTFLKEKSAETGNHDANKYELLKNNFLHCSTVFKSVTTSEIINFFSSETSFDGRYLPVNMDKSVVTGRASASNCQMTLNALKTLVNNRGTLQRFEGVNDDGHRTDPISAVGFAIQHRYKSIGIDLDAIVFDGHGGSKLPQELLEWIETRYETALITRGNRKRACLIFKLSTELGEKLKASGRHGLSFSLLEGLNQKVELKFGNQNNTVWGLHPSGNEYQQILPQSGFVGELSESDFVELVTILESVSIGKDKRYKGEVSGDRIHLEDASSLIDDIENDILAYEQINAKFNLGVNFSLSVMDFLSTQSKKIINGEGYFDGYSFLESNEEQPITEGGRYYTWFNVGSDVNLIVGLFNRSNVDYDHDEVESIIERMLELTELVSSGKGRFTEEDAISAFKCTEDFPTGKESYIRSLVLKMRQCLQQQLQTAIDESRKKGGDKTMDTAIVSFDNVRVDNFDIEKSMEDNGFEFEIILADEVEEYSAENEKQLEIISDKLIEQVAKVKEEQDEYETIIKNVYSDDSTIFTKKTRYMTSIGKEMVGSTFSMISQVIPVFTGVGRYVEGENKEYAPYKPGNCRTTYETPFIPFAVNVGDSGIGKTQLFNLVSGVANNVAGMLGGTSDTDKTRFMNQFGDPKRESKFRKVDFDAVTGEALDPALQKVRNIVQFGVKQEIDDYLMNVDQHVTNDITSAGLRRLIGVQDSRVKIRKATESLHFAESYEHPLTLYSDELVSTFNTIYDPKSTYLTGADIMQRKGAKGLNVLRGETTYSYSRCGVAIAGNLTTNNFKKYLAKEIKEGTDGILPRFLFTPLYQKSEEQLAEITDWDVDNSKRAQIDIAGMALCIRYASIHSDNLKNCPWHHNRKLFFGDEAQQRYDEFAQYIKGERERLIVRYPEFAEWIKSLFGKSHSELSVWSQGMNVFEQADNMWFAIKEKLNMDEISVLLRSRDSDDVFKAVQVIETELALLFSSGKHEFSLEITGEQVDRAIAMLKHNYAFIELCLYELDTKQNNIDSYVKKLQKEKIIASANPEEYLLSKTTEAILKVMPSVASDKGEDGFTSSEISRKSNFLKSKKNPKLVTKILETMCDLNVLRQVNTGNKIKFVSTLSKKQLIERSQQIKHQMCEFVF